MLIISRRVSEIIMINDDLIKIMVLGIRGMQVRLGIEAPKEISVHREEIWQKVVEQRERENE